MSKKKILFLTLLKINSLDERGIYSDLLKKFHNNGHEIFIVCPNERREKKGTELNKNYKSQILKVKTLNIQKTSLIEKGIATLLIEYQFLNAIKKYFSEIKFDLVLYSTPPITFSKVIEYVKKRDAAFSYLLLKDIFPQNAVDMKLIKKNGIIHKYFLRKEKKLYQLSDKIGCMSKANLVYLKKHNSYLDFKKIEINPNTISPKFINYSSSEKENIKLKYSIPLKKKIFIYGGNLGKPQGLDFLLKTIQETKISDVFFLIIGSGTEYARIQKWFKKMQPKNAKLIAALPKNDYDKLLAACDVGLIFLNRNFTIPNYPSRLLSYLEMSMPVIASTDVNTDIGTIIEKAECGFWVESGDIKSLQKAILEICSNKELFIKMKKNSRNLLNSQYTVDKSYNLIMEKFTNINIK